jgi:hypothetical protein
VIKFLKIYLIPVILGFYFPLDLGTLFICELLVGSSKGQRILNQAKARRPHRKRTTHQIREVVDRYYTVVLLVLILMTLVELQDPFIFLHIQAFLAERTNSGFKFGD